ncbi:MAG: serine acetyltransferase [Eubacterium sp.]|nr:serine acetyltransferase [Eubacterium sp.]
MHSKIEVEIKDIVNHILEDYENEKTIDAIELFDQPDMDVVADITKKLLNIVYPGYYRDRSYRFYNDDSRLAVIIEDVVYNLTKQISIVLRQLPENSEVSPQEIEERAQQMSLEFFRKIPKVREYTETDVLATFDGDPAAFNKNEIILCYPGLYAITINRLAHEMFLLGIPIIPRMMTEQAHSKTGIDIHPGATLGKYFFIDHGTGIVVGETTIIGDYVKVYQGVTIGALSTRGGQRLKGVKRHPTIEDHVTIYAGASILGGETVIGRGAVIGSNAFITKSVEPGVTVSIKNQQLDMKSKYDYIEASELNPEENWFYTI